MQAIYVQVNGQLVKILVYVNMTGDVIVDQALKVDSADANLDGIAIATDPN